MKIKQVFPGILVVLGLVSIFLVGPDPAPAEMMPQASRSGQNHVEVIRQADSQGGLAVRSEPSPNGQIVAYLPVGSKVTYEGEASNGWVRLSAPTAGGWVAGSYLGTRNPVALVIGVDNPGQCLAVRNGPGMSYEKIGCLPKGAKLELTGTVQKDWAQIAGPMAGWVTAQQIQAPGLFPAKEATSGATRRGSTEAKVQNSGVTGTEFSEQPAVSSGQPSDPTGAGQLMDFIRQNIQSGQSAPSGGTGGQTPQQLPNQNVPTNASTTQNAPTTTTKTNPGGSTTPTSNPAFGVLNPGTTPISKTNITNTGNRTQSKMDVVSGVTTTKVIPSQGTNPDGTTFTENYTETTTKITNSDSSNTIVTKTFDGKGKLIGEQRDQTSKDGTLITRKADFFNSDGSRSPGLVETRDPVTGTYTTTTFNSDGSLQSQSRNDGQGHLIDSKTCDAPGKCSDPTKTIATQELRNKGQSGAAQALKNNATAIDPKKLLSAPGADQLKDRAKFQDTKVGAKKIQADVLGQIEGKPAGDLSVSQKSISTGVLGSKAVELNPQPLPPGLPTSDKLGGKIQFDKKLQTGTTQLFKDKVKVQDLKLDQKWKLGSGSGSQSTGQINKVNAASKLNFQTQAAQRNKFKLNQR